MVWRRRIRSDREHVHPGLTIPEFFAVLAIAAEFLGGIGLLFGLLSRVAAFGIAVNMIVAVALVHGRNGLFMNWTGKQPGEGFEFHLLVLAMSLFVMVRGAGAWSVDRVLETSLTGGRTLRYSHGTRAVEIIAG